MTRHLNQSQNNITKCTYLMLLRGPGKHKYRLGRDESINITTKVRNSLDNWQQPFIEHGSLLQVRRIGIVTV